MSLNTLSSFTLAVALMVTVGIGYNNNAGATPPKEKKVATEAIHWQMSPSNTVLQSKLAEAMATKETEFHMGSGSTGMGFQGTGTGGGGDDGFGRIHGLGVEKKAATKVVKKKTRPKAAQKKEGEPASSTPPGCSCPVQDATPNMTLER